jgi:hypothetical protein
MEKLEARDGVVYLKPDEYRRLVQANPRPYHIVMLWNVKPGPQCDHCNDVGKEFNQVAYSFGKSRGSDLNHIEKKIFFCVLEFDKDKSIQQIYKENDMLTVPFLTVSPMDLKRDHTQLSIFKTEDKWLVSGNEVFDANKQIEFVNNILRTDVKIKFPFSTILINNFLGICMIAVLFQGIKSIYNILLNQWVWFGVAITVFVICTGGIVYSMLNNSPLFKFRRNEYGSVVVEEYIMRGQRGQYAGEGYIASCLFTLIGLSYLFLANVEKFATGK